MIDINACIEKLPYWDKLTAEERDFVRLSLIHIWAKKLFLSVLRHPPRISRVWSRRRASLLSAAV